MCAVDGRLDCELPPGQVLAPPPHLTYVDPTQILGHNLHFCEVRHRNGRHHEGHLVFCRYCGAYFWQRAYAMLLQCGLRGGAQLPSQLQRIMAGLFPSAQRRYMHLELGQPSRLTGPRAALVQQQLEEMSKTNFAGARAPNRRRRVKSACVRLVEFPRATPSPYICRTQLKQAYGLTDELLATLVEQERLRLENAARNVRTSADSRPRWSNFGSAS